MNKNSKRPSRKRIHMARQETGESSNLMRSSASSFEGCDRVHDPRSTTESTLVPLDIDLWSRTLISGWTEQYLDPLIETGEPEIFLLFQGRQLDLFEKTFDEKITTLTCEGRLPALQPGEDYPLEYLPEIGEAYEETCDEIGWEPVGLF